MRFSFFAMALAALVLSSAAAVAAPAPRLAVQSLSQLSDLPYPFDPERDANRDVAAASARAAAEGKLLLIDLGGNWCPDCRILAGVMDLPEMKAFLAAHYVLVSVDIGHLDRNLQIPARYGITRRLEAAPAILIVDPKTNVLLDKGHILLFDDTQSNAPQAIADWLAQWTP